MFISHPATRQTQTCIMQKPTPPLHRFVLLSLSNCRSPSGLPRTAVVGVLGGGQLGRMMALAAVRHEATSIKPPILCCPGSAYRLLLPCSGDSYAPCVSLSSTCSAHLDTRLLCSTNLRQANALLHRTPGWRLQNNVTLLTPPLLVPTCRPTWASV